MKRCGHWVNDYTIVIFWMLTCYLIYRQAKNLTQDHLPSVQFFPFKKLVRKGLQTWCLDYFAARVKMLFFSDCYQCSSSAGVLSVDSIVEQNQWKNLAQKKLQRLELKFLHTEEDVFWLSVILYSQFCSCLTFTQTS